MKSTDIPVNGNIVVIKDDKKVSLACSRIIKAFQSQTSCKGTVTDKRN
jgi:hypothetical protein